MDPCVTARRRRARDRDRARMPQDFALLFRLTLAATPAEATPNSTSAVLGHSQVQITREASHRADEVENVVLVACRDQLPKQAELLTRLSPHSLRLGRVVPVLPVGPAVLSRPSGVRGPVLNPPCTRHRPFGIAGWQHGLPSRLRLAPHREAACARSRWARQPWS